jgi:hypothetical protein
MLDQPQKGRRAAATSMAVLASATVGHVRITPHNRTCAVFSGTSEKGRFCCKNRRCRCSLNRLKSHRH